MSGRAPSHTSDGSGDEEASTVSLLTVQTPTRAIERYRQAEAAILLGVGGSGDRGTNRSESYVSSGRRSPSFLIDHPQVIAQTLGYSWRDSYMEQSPHQQRDRWLRHQTFGPVMVSEGGTSLATTVASTPHFQRNTSDAWGAGPGRGGGDYAQRYYPENVWSYRPAVVAAAAAGGGNERGGKGATAKWLDEGSSELSSSEHTVGTTASEVMAVSVAAPARRRRGMTTTHNAATKSPPTAGIAIPDRRQVQSARASLAQEPTRNVAGGKVSGQRQNSSGGVRGGGAAAAAVVSKPLLPSPVEEGPRRSNEARLAAEEELYRNERKTKLSSQPEFLATPSLSMIQRDVSLHEKPSVVLRSMEEGVSDDPPPVKYGLSLPPILATEGNEEVHQPSASSAVPFSSVATMGTRQSVPGQIIALKEKQQHEHEPPEVNTDKPEDALGQTKRMVRGAQGRPLRAVYQDEDD